MLLEYPPKDPGVSDAGPAGQLKRLRDVMRLISLRIILITLITHK